MNGSESSPPSGTNGAKVEFVTPLVVRIYGPLQKRITRFAKKKGITRSTTVKLLTGEGLEKAGY